MASRNAVTNSSLGFTGTPFRPFVDRELRVFAPWSLGLTSSGQSLRADRGINTKGTSSVYVPGVGYQNVSNGSLGIDAIVSTSVIRHTFGSSSLGLTVGDLQPSMGRTTGGIGSLGLSVKDVNAAMGRNVAATGSLGLGGATRISKLYVPRITGSLGITCTGSPKLKFLRGAAKGSLGFSGFAKGTLRRAGWASGRLGLGATVQVSVKPALTPDSIALVEMQDGSAPSTFGSAEAREYQNFLGDQTITSYPKPFTLKN